MFSVDNSMDWWDSVIEQEKKQYSHWCNICDIRLVHMLYRETGKFFEITLHSPHRRGTIAICRECLK